MIRGFINRILGRPAGNGEAPTSQPPKRSPAPAAVGPAFQVAAMVNASALPPDIKAALLDPVTAITPITAPAAIETAASILDIAAARFGGNNRSGAVQETAVLVRGKHTLESARAALIAARIAEDEAVGEIVTAHPPRGGVVGAPDVYRRRKKGQ